MYKLYTDYTSILQKTITILPYLKFILSLLALYYVKIFLTEEKSLMRIYLLTIIQTLDSVFKTFFWFILFIISQVL